MAGVPSATGGAEGTEEAREEPGGGTGYGWSCLSAQFERTEFPGKRQVITQDFATRRGRLKCEMRQRFACGSSRAGS